jgi:hypothetical protein
LDAEEEPFAISLEVTGAVQIATALRGAFAAPIDRGNRRTELQFSVLRRHQSVAAATDFLLSHGAGLLDLEGTVTLVSEGPTQSVFTLSPAVLRRVQGTQEGASTTHSYAILGGSLTLT